MMAELEVMSMGDGTGQGQASSPSGSDVTLKEFMTDFVDKIFSEKYLICNNNLYIYIYIYIYYIYIYIYK